MSARRARRAVQPEPPPSGTLVLLDSAISLDTLPEGARRFLRSPYLNGPPNACFKLLRSFVPSRSWAGIAPIGVTQWATDSTGSITFTLYRSPDANHTVRAVDTLRGTGKSVGFGAVEVHWPRDTVIVARVGPPSIAPCVEAMQDHYVKPPPPALRPGRGSGRPLHQ